MPETFEPQLNHDEKQPASLQQNSYHEIEDAYIIQFTYTGINLRIHAKMFSS